MLSPKLYDKGCQPEATLSLRGYRNINTEKQEVPWRNLGTSFQRKTIYLGGGGTGGPHTGFGTVHLNQFEPGESFNDLKTEEVPCINAMDFHK